MAKTDRKPAKPDDKIISSLLANFKLSTDAEADNRKYGLEDVKFSLGGDEQWDAAVLVGRRSDAGGNRPCDSYNQMPQFIHQIVNDQRQNMPQVKFIPGNDATKELAEVREDLVRNIQASSEAEVAVDTAVDGQVRNGWGYFRILTDYEHSGSFEYLRKLGPAASNQIIKFGRISNPFTVYDDPNTILQDRSDRKFLIQVCDEPVDTFNDTYDRKYGTTELTGIGDKTPGWATDDTIRIAEYWRVKENHFTIYIDKVTGEVTKDEPENAENYDSRSVTEQTVMWYKCTATEVLDRKEWVGKYIPYVFVAGEEVDVNGKKIYSGIVRNAKSSQKQYNYQSNAITEAVALAPKAPFIMAVGQIEGLEKYWDNLNVKNYPYLPYRPIEVGGRPVPPPQRQQAEAPIQGMIVLKQQAQQDLYATTSIYPASLGKSSTESSGIAISRREHQSDVANFHYTDNTARAIRFAGRILDDLIPKIYDTPRQVGLLKEDRSARTVTINQPFEDESGEMQHYDMRQGVYDIGVTTGPNFTTKRQEAVDQITQIIQAAPQLLEVAGDLLVGNMDWPGADKLAERLKKTLPPQLQDQPNMKDVPPQVQAQIQQMSQQLEQAQQVIQQGSQELQQLQQQVADKQGDLQVKQADLQLKARQQQIDAEDSARKDQLEAAKLKIEQQKVTAQPAGNPATSADPNQQLIDFNDPNVVMAHLQNIHEKSEQAQMDAQMAAEQKQREQEQHIQIESEKEQNQDARTQALMVVLTDIDRSLKENTAAQLMPKTLSISRDPETGLIKSGTVN